MFSDMGCLPPYCKTVVLRVAFRPPSAPKPLFIIPKSANKTIEALSQNLVPVSTGTRFSHDALSTLTLQKVYVGRVSRPVLPEFSDGSSVMVVKSKEEMLEVVSAWADEAHSYPGEPAIIEYAEMTNEEIDNLPTI
ncbi:MAG: hypothetical protein R6U98_14020 [Pirellulaceae bacterium]